MFTNEITDKPVINMGFVGSKKEYVIYLKEKTSEVPQEDLNSKMYRETRWNEISNALNELRKNKLFTPKTEERLREALFSRKPPSLSREKDLYEDALQILNRDKGRDFYSNIMECLPLFLPEKNEQQMHVVNVCGQSGSGKTTFVNKCMRKVLEFFPKSKLFVFSRKNSDPSLDVGLKHNIKRIQCDESWLDFDNKIEDYKGTKDCPNYLIFDDYERIHNLEVQKSVHQFLIAAVETARQLNIHIFIIRHEILTGIKNRTLITESTGFVLFPQGSPRHQCEVVLTNQYGLKQSQIDRIFTLPSRWVYISKKVPKFVVYERGFYILDN